MRELEWLVTLVFRGRLHGPFFGTRHWAMGLLRAARKWMRSLWVSLQSDPQRGRRKQVKQSHTHVGMCENRGQTKWVVVPLVSL